VDNTSTREFGGTGLGLAIVRNFMRAHDGDVKVESQEGVGSTFTVRLPYNQEKPSPPAGA
jgi:signal transduction histidine kinase